MQLEKALEEPTRRRAAAETIAHYCTTSKHDFQEHVPSLLMVSLYTTASYLLSRPEIRAPDCQMFPICHA